MKEDAKVKRNRTLITTLLLLGIILLVVVAYALGARTEGLRLRAGVEKEQTATAGEDPYVFTDPEMSVCWFMETDLASTDESVSGWEVFEGYGYSFRYPGNTVTVESGEEGPRLSFYDGLHRVQLHSYQLGVDDFSVHTKNVGEVAYEPFSNSWWIDMSLGTRGLESYEECHPSPIGLTNDGVHEIYAALGGQEPMTFSPLRYFTVMRDIDGDNAKIPLVVMFKYTSDHMYTEPGLREEEFKNLLENIVKSLELTPTAKG